MRSHLVANKEYFQALVARMDGDNYPDADDRFDHAPIFPFTDGLVEFRTNWYDNANDNYG